MKKIVAIMLIIVSIITLTACSGIYTARVGDEHFDKEFKTEKEANAYIEGFEGGKEFQAEYGLASMPYKYYYSNASDAYDALRHAAVLVDNRDYYNAIALLSTLRGFENADELMEDAMVYAMERDMWTYSYLDDFDYAYSCAQYIKEAAANNAKYKESLDSAIRFLDMYQNGEFF